MTPRTHKRCLAALALAALLLATLHAPALAEDSVAEALLASESEKHNLQDDSSAQNNEQTQDPPAPPADTGSNEQQQQQTQDAPSDQGETGNNEQQQETQDAPQDQGETGNNEQQQTQDAPPSQGDTVEQKPEDAPSETPQDADGPQPIGDIEQVHLSADQQRQQDELDDKNAQAEYEERMKLLQEWEEKMSDFKADEMLTFELDKGAVDEFLQEIIHPTTIRGAYFVSFFSQDKIDFSIQSPSGKTVYENRRKREGIFSLKVQEPGFYKIIFNNKRGKDNKFVTFAIDVYEAPDDHATTSKLSPLEQQVDTVIKQLNSVKTETDFSTKREMTYFQKIRKTTKKMMLLCVCETFAIIGATVWQTWYIKRILDNRRIV